MPALRACVHCAVERETATGGPWWGIAWHRPLVGTNWQLGIGIGIGIGRYLRASIGYRQYRQIPVSVHLYFKPHFSKKNVKSVA